MARFVPGKGFAMVPAWMALRQPTGNAMLVYVHLAMFGRWNPGSARYEDCNPSRQELATGVPDTDYDGTGLSVPTIKRAMRELLDLGAIVGKVRFGDDGSQLPTTYEVIFGELSAPALSPRITGDPPPPGSRVTLPPRITGDPPRGVAGDPPPGSRVTPLIEEVLKKEEQTSTSSPLPPGKIAKGSTVQEPEEVEEDSSKIRNGAGLATLAARALALAPHWSKKKLDDVLNDPDILARVAVNAAGVEAAVLALAGGEEYGHTHSPAGILREGPWWADKMGTARPAPPERVYVPPQRGCGSCLAGVVFVEQPDGQDKPHPCPTCSPVRQGVAA